MGVSERSKLTWEAKPRRWRKVHKGKVYTISCRDLGTPETKEASYRAANEWWVAKLAELHEMGESKPVGPRHITLEMLRKRLRWAEDHGHPRIVADYKERLARAERIAAHVPSTPMEKKAWTEALDREYPYPDDMEERTRDAKGLGMKVDDIRLPSLLDDLVGEGQVWTERFRTASATKVPEDRTVAGLVKTWLINKEVEMRAGQLAPKRYDNLKYEMRSIEMAIGPKRAAESIDEAAVDRVYHHYMEAVAEGKLARETAKTRWGLFRAFVKFAWSRRLIELPRNLEERSITSPPVAVPTWSVEEVKATITASTGQLKLHLLLMINLGMYQKDIADLKDSEVDWHAGTITRRRSKTKGAKGSPTVTHKLWPPTFALLKEFRSGGEVVLLTGDGRQWVRAEPKSGGKILQCDGIARNYRRLVASHRKKHPDKPLAARPLKELRKTSASLLDNHGEHGRYAQHFLGQSPRSVADRHYVTPSQDRFNAAVLWLGQYYGYVT